MQNSKFCYHDSVPDESTTSSTPCPADEIDLSRSRSVSSLCDQLKGIATAATAEEASETFIKEMQRIFKRNALMLIDTRGLVDRQFRVTHLASVEGVDLVDSLETDEGGVSVGGFVGNVIAENRPRLFTDINIQNDPAFDNHLVMYRSAMAVPTLVDGRSTLWAWAFSFQPESFSKGALAGFMLRVNFFGAAIDNIRMRRSLGSQADADHAGLQTQIDLRRKMSTTKQPELRGIESAVHVDPRPSGGGELCQLYALAGRSTKKDDPRWAVVMIDVHDRSPVGDAALAMCKAVLDTIDHAEFSAGGLLSVLNDYLCKTFEGSVTATGIAAIYNGGTRTLEYAVANHAPPMLRRPHFRGDVEVIAMRGADSTVLGDKADVTFENFSEKLVAEDSLLFYSDGMTDAVNPDDEPFGKSRIETLLRLSSGGPDDVIEKILRSVREHESHQDPVNDQSMAAVRVHY